MTGWTYPIERNQDNSLAEWDGTIKVRKNLIVDGNVGIGTATPVSLAGYTTLLMINGKYAALVLNGTSSKEYEIGTAADDNLIISTGATRLVNINGTSENVGIGTASPTAKVHAYSETTSAVLGKFNTDATTGIQLESAGAGRDRVNFLSYSGSTLKILLNSAGDSYFNGGNVGIGTSTPDYKLSVIGTIEATDETDYLRLTAGAINKISYSGSMYLFAAASPTHYFSSTKFAIKEAETTASTTTWRLSTVGTYDYLQEPSSSIKYKTNIENLKDWHIEFESDFMKIRPVKFNSICKVDDPARNWIGFIAEELAEIHPCFVDWKEEEDGKKVPMVEDQRTLLALIILMVQKLKKENEDLNKRIEVLENVTTVP